MDEKEEKGFPWTSCFFVTGICLILFSSLMHLLDGAPLKLFTKLGFVSLGLGILSFLNSWLGLKIVTPKGKSLPAKHEQTADSF